MNYKVYIRSIACQTRYIPPQPNIIPALIGAAAVLGSGIVGAVSGNSQNKANLREQRRINAENIAFQREMFAKKSAREDVLNANSALLQRQSLEKAGLNPNIGNYGQLQTNVSQGTPSSQAYAGQNPFTGIDAGALANLIQNQPLVDAEVAKRKAEKNLIEKQAGVAEADKLLKVAQRWSIEQLTPEQKKQFEEGTKKLIAETHKIDVDKELVQKTIDKVMEETDALRISNNLMTAETPLILQKFATEIALLNSQGQLTDAETLVAYKSLSVMDAQIKDFISRAHLNDKQALYVSQEALRVAIDNQYKPFEKANELELGDEQIRQAKQMVENLKQNYNWVPFNNIVGAIGGFVGSAAGSFVGASLGRKGRAGAPTGSTYPSYRVNTTGGGFR